jgi:alkaline phosphatase
MTSPSTSIVRSAVLAVAASLALVSAYANPSILRLTPPSMLFSFNDDGNPVTSRFLPGQRFDLQATVAPSAGQTITDVRFFVDGLAVTQGVTLLKTGLLTTLPTGATVATTRAYSNLNPGVHKLYVLATQSDGTITWGTGNFEIVGITQTGRRAKNIILCIGDGMGIAHRTAARIVSQGYQQGKANAPLAMDTFPVTGIVMTSSLNSIVTDSAPGAHCYSTGNKANNSQEGVFPDDTLDAFDNPRIEYASEYLKRTQGKALGIVTTADVFDATPAAMAVHTSNRGNGTGICDQYLDESGNTGLTVLLGGGRKWFLPAKTNNVAQATSARKDASDYVLPAELTSAWGVPAGTLDSNRDLIGDFKTAGWTYVPDRTSLNAIPAGTKKLLGLFSYSNMNVAKDKIDGRRGVNGPNGQPVVNDYLLPDQPMLDEMTDKALQVLNQNPAGFFLMIEGASIDKQAHLMDSDRWILETIEFDRAVARAQAFAANNPDTLVLVTADHECGGINIVGASVKTAAQLKALVNTPTPVTQIISNNIAGIPYVTTNYIANNLRDTVMGNYDAAGFPAYAIANDGYPTTTDPDYKVLIGYAGGADRYENYLTAATPDQDSQQPLIKNAPLVNYPIAGTNRAANNGFFLYGQVPGDQAVHTASDIPISAYGRGSAQFTGVMDNTDVFFKAMQAVLGGVR